MAAQRSREVWEVLLPTKMTEAEVEEFLNLLRDNKLVVSRRTGGHVTFRRKMPGE